MEATAAKREKRRARTGVAQYLDDMAEDDDDDDDDDQDESRAWGEVSRPKRVKVAEEEEDVEFAAEVARQNLRREHEPVFGVEADDVAGVVESLRSRYRAQQPRGRSSTFMADTSGEVCGSLEQTASRSAVRQVQAPSLTDPRLWVVGVRMGSEQEACVALMNKAAHYERQGMGELGLTGAMATGLRQFVYLEARSEVSARRAIEGLRVFRPTTLKMVPLADMISVVSAEARSGVRVRQRRRRLRVGDWARLARGEVRYKGDICRVVAVSEDGAAAVVQLVPRQGGGGSKPPFRLFSASEVIAAGGSVEQRRFRGGAHVGGAALRWRLADELFEVYNRGYYRGGFLYKEVCIDSMLAWEEPRPTLDELERFIVDHSFDDLAGGQLALQHAIKRLASGTEVWAGANLARGDRVEATDGDLRGLILEVERIEPTSDRTQFTQERVRPALVWCRHHRVGLVPVEADKLVKSIAVGARVKVSDGRYAGATGVVLECGELNGDHVAVLLTDHNGREITVRLAHAHETSEVGVRVQDSLEGFELFDLVQLPLGGAGLVVHLYTEDLDVLDMRGALRRHLRPADLTRKLNAESSRNVALDACDEHVREKDVIILSPRGPRDNAGLIAGEATVIRAYKGILWVQPLATRGRVDQTNGVQPVKARHTRVAGAHVAAAGLADTYMGLGWRRRRVVSEATFNHDHNATALVAGRSQPRGRTVTATAAARPTRDPLIGRVVRICKGNYKGLAGMVKSATTTHVTVELYTRNKVVTELRERVKEIKGLAGGDEPANVAHRVAVARDFRLDTPFLTEATPMLGAATPQHGAFTPGRATPTIATPSRPQTPSAVMPAWPQTPHREQLHDVWKPRHSPPDPDQPIPDFGDEDGDPASLLMNRTRGAIKSDAPEPNDDGDEDGEAWCMPGVAAIAPDGEPCRVEVVSGRCAKVTLDSCAVHRDIAISKLRRVPPEPRDLVRVNDAGAVYDARLLEIEDTDGIIKLDTGEYKIIDLAAIAKVAIENKPTVATEPTSA